jgi:hypothetical protein
MRLRKRLSDKDTGKRWRVRMRTEAEVRQMLEEVREIYSKEDNKYGKGPAKAVMAALENVLNGPRKPGWCACLGPAGCCVCQMHQLASETTAKMIR